MNRLPLLAVLALALALGCQSRPATAPADGPQVDYGPMPRVVGDTTARPAAADSLARPTTDRPSVPAVKSGS